MEERDVHDAAILLLGRGNFPLRRFELAQHAVDVIEEVLACMRELGTPRMAHKERRAELVLELRNRARERRLRHGTFFGRFREMTHTRHRLKILQL